MHAPKASTGSRGRATAAVARGLLCGCLAVALASAVDAQNVLVVLLDDVGVDKIGAYGASPTAGPTPVIDQLVAEGVAFRKASAMPVCSPTRASALTGLLPSRTGVGKSVNWEGESGPYSPDPSAFVSFPQRLRRAGWATAAVGKWHLSQASDSDPLMSPHHWGFDTYRGCIANLYYDGGDYSAWTQTTTTADGAVTAPATGYATTRQVDDALELIDGFGEAPWLLWLAFSAPHKPLHEPPAHLHTQGDLTGAGEPALYRAVLEALDTELGRLLQGLRDEVLSRTWIVVMGDNGTYNSAMEPPFGAPLHAKNFVYEGGVNVPLVVVGPGVPPGWSDALVSCTDLYATILELAGLDVPAGAAEDSLSFAPSLFDPGTPGARRAAVTQRFEPNGFGEPELDHRGARDGRWKLVRRNQDEFYDLLTDPHEELDLLSPFTPPLTGEGLAAYERLQQVLAAVP